ncbi:MAG: DUF5597 domain-containing protein [Mycobacteriales bacterium]
MTEQARPKTDRWCGAYLAVDGRPFPVIGAEVHNSSSSTLNAIASSFETVRQLGANTVLAPVAWDLLEPVRGQFDFTLTDAMIATARDMSLRLIPLWFGTWKNAVSTYAPPWIKTDTAQFPRAVLSDGRRVEHVTPFCTAARDADARAFAALMAHIRDVDKEGTVLAVQVENEIGLLGDSRDRSPLAEAAFQQPVPAAVVEAIAADPGMPLHEEWVALGAKRTGSWAELFPAGVRCDEAFMATAFASYTGAVAAAGAGEHDIPLYVNAWLDADSVLDGPTPVAGGKQPGDYPSGGPVMPVAAIWEALAPALHFLAVDMYVEDAEPVFAAYRSRRGRLFVPELRADAVGIAQMFSALGTHRAVGVAPFGVDVLDPQDRGTAQLVDAFSLLRAAASIIREHPTATMYGFHLDELNPAPRLQFGDVGIQINTKDEWGMFTPTYPGYGIAIEADEGIYVIGRGFWVTLKAPEGRELSLLSAKHYVPDRDGMTLVSRLNGDEGGGNLIPFPFAGARLVPGRVIPTRVPDGGITHLSIYTY